MVNAAAAAGKRKVKPAASYNEAGSDSDEEDDEYVERKATKTPATANEKKTKSAVGGEPAAKKAKAEAKVAAAAAKSAAADNKSVIARLGVLDKAQLTAVLKGLVESGKVSAGDIEGVLPAPDMSTYVKEGERLSTAIRRALPNSRWGSCTDHYGYKRCASANNACKKYILDNAKVFKAAKQWPTALEYAAAMLPVARGMVSFDLPDDCKARDAAIATLTALKAEAEGKLGTAKPAAGSWSGGAASAPPPAAAWASAAPAAVVD